jgi:hypothetical protein
MRRARGRADGSGDDQGTIDVLAAARAFAGCDRTALRAIAGRGTEVRRGPGAVLATEGAVLRQVVVVLEGVVAERPAHGRERAVSAGHVLGEEALTRLHAVGRTTATALTDVRLLVFGPAELGEVAELLQVQPAPASQRVRVPSVEPAWGSARPALA